MYSTYINPHVYYLNKHTHTFYTDRVEKRKKKRQGRGWKNRATGEEGNQQKQGDKDMKGDKRDDLGLYVNYTHIHTHIHTRTYTGDNVNMTTK